VLVFFYRFSLWNITLIKFPRGSILKLTFFWSSQLQTKWTQLEATYVNNNND